ncbi:P-loop containing nucleoside triphosphate hydrolase protein [Obba rivulosa]|uniref:P-loop containing nucleoside triphosphate hydrolase protein n=1 Tax=Obba rivulosa TaxID=1052685 RepID=A0A8E2AS75_9APHY|nr:P-loop containing nucleoside triphosphate hydrolase protein [Obba rivulosa]
MQSFTSTVEQQLGAPLPNPALQLLIALKNLYPGSQHVAIVESLCPQFPVLKYLDFAGIPYTPLDAETHNAYVHDQESNSVVPRSITGVMAFTYEGVQLRVFEASWRRDRESLRFVDFVFDGKDDGMGRKLLSAVYEWANSLREEMWVFENGGWSKHKDLFRAVQKSTWDDIVLDENFREGLRRDTKTFFSSKEIYQSLGVTWKRGLLLLGPPGNGKTESIKALLHEFDYAALYVKSINTSMGPEFGVRAVFEHARKHAPCILVLEDLDSMITDKVRSFFLNEIDGLAQNEGILTIATTNHPELIDDAILNRPSRFDVKYDFALPTAELRNEFATKWLRKVYALDTGIVFQKSIEELASAIADKTNAWSFAFLKELFVSFLLRIAHDKSLGKDTILPADEILLDQVEKLALQIIKIKEGKGKVGEDDADQGTGHVVRRFRMAQRVTEAHPLNL